GRTKGSGISISPNSQNPIVIRKESGKLFLGIASVCLLMICSQLILRSACKRYGSAGFGRNIKIYFVHPRLGDDEFSVIKCFIAVKTTSRYHNVFADNIEIIVRLLPVYRCAEAKPDMSTAP